MSLSLDLYIVLSFAFRIPSITLSTRRIFGHLDLEVVLYSRFTCRRRGERWPSGSCEVLVAKRRGEKFGSDGTVCRPHSSVDLAGDLVTEYAQLSGLIVRVERRCGETREDYKSSAATQAEPRRPSARAR